jgi:hypothetical protein
MNAECVICHACLRNGPGRSFLTLPDKEEIEALTGRWRSDAVGWMCPACIRRNATAEAAV